MQKPSIFEDSISLILEQISSSQPCIRFRNQQFSNTPKVSSYPIGVESFLLINMHIFLHICQRPNQKQVGTLNLNIIKTGPQVNCPQYGVTKTRNLSTIASPSFYMHVHTIFTKLRSTDAIYLIEKIIYTTLIMQCTTKKII